jgi:copper chaperone NosL
MSSFGQRFTACLDRPIGGWSRFFLVLLSGALVLGFTAPLWRISMEAPQYPDGLHIDVFLYKLEGGHQGHDIAEINELNHYIGMMTIDRHQLVDLDWLPFAFGVLFLLQLRAAAIGNGRALIDISFLSLFVCLFALGRFVYKLYAFGHFLDPHAAIHIDPFMPVILGTKQIANFTTHSFPRWGSAYVAANVLCVIAVTLRHFWSVPFGRRKERSAEQERSAAAEANGRLAAARSAASS